MDIHYYFLCYRVEALVASHLTPEEFGAYMAVGTRKLASGKVVFFEIDPSLRSDHFKLDEVRAQCVPHSDGTPKRSKYVSVYRVLEHLPVSVFGRLYLTTGNGRVMGIDASDYADPTGESGPNLYQELCPMTPMVASRLAPAGFVRWITGPDNRVGAPRIVLADLLLERDKNGALSESLPYSRPEHIRECLDALEQQGGKDSKTVDRSGSTQGFFRTVRRGFFVGDPGALKHYRFPSREQLEVNHSRWWKAAQAD